MKEAAVERSEGLACNKNKENILPISIMITGVPINVIRTGTLTNKETPQLLFVK